MFFLPFTSFTLIKSLIAIFLAMIFFIEKESLTEISKKTNLYKKDNFFFKIEKK